MNYKQAIVIKNDFTNLSLAGHGKTLNNFVQNYAARPDATQSIPGVGMAKTWSNQINDYYLQDQFNSKLSFEQLARDYLQSEGVSFDNHSLSLNSADLQSDAQGIQQAYLQGHSVMKLLVSFDTDYLINQNVVQMHHFKDEQGNKIAQAFPGGGFDLVDETKLRYAVQNGMNKYIRQNGMQDPLWVGALQFDRQHVHAHIACVDRGQLQDSKRLINYNGVWQDKGKISAKGKEILRSNIDSALTLTKGMHRSVENNQSARALVNTKSQTFDLQSRYQQRLASQLLQLLRLNNSRTNRMANDDLYYEKLGDYRDSLVMQEAKQFNLPQSMTKVLNQRLDQALDQQIQQLGRLGIPGQTDVLNGFLGSAWSQQLQDQAQTRRQQVEQSGRGVSSWQYLLKDYNRQFQAGQAGNGSLSMAALYGFELDTSLKQLTVEQSRDPLGLIANYQRRGDLVNNRRFLLDQRERLIEKGYQSGALFNPSQQELKQLLNNPQFCDELLKVANQSQRRGKYWLANQSDRYQRVGQVPAYQDLLLKANSVDNNIGVSPDTVDMLSRTSFVRGELLNELAGRSLSPQLRKALSPSGNDFRILDQYPGLKQFAYDLKDYQSRVIDYTVSGTKRGLLRPLASFADPRLIMVPDKIKRPLDVRNQFDLDNWGHLSNQIDWSSSDGNLRYGHLVREQEFIKSADLYSQVSDQRSLALINVKQRQQNDLNRLAPVLGQRLKQQINDDDHDIEQVLDFRSGRKKKNATQQVSTSRPVNNRKNINRQWNIQRRQELRAVRQQEMNEDEAENVVDDSRKLVHRVLSQELNI